MDLIVDSMVEEAPKVSSNFKSFEARDQDGALPSNVPTESFNAASLSRNMVCRVQSSKTGAVEGLLSSLGSSSRVACVSSTAS